MGFDPIGWAGDAVDWVDNAAGDAGAWFRDNVANAGKNNFQPTPYNPTPQYWGGYDGAAADYASIGQQGIGKSNAMADWAQGQAQQTGPQAFENQQLSNNEATSRGYHQEGALNLALQGALGNQPSVAAYQLQSGLDRALANQSAIAGGARGAAGLATAQQNAAAAGANLQNQAFTEAGRLRAQEIQGYTGMYGQLAGQQREQDQARLGMGNQMSQFNAQNQTQRQLGFGQLANESQRTGQGWYGQMGHGYDQQLGSDQRTEENRQKGYETSMGLGASIAQANADQRANWRDRIGSTITQFGTTGIQMGAGGK